MEQSFVVAVSCCLRPFSRENLVLTGARVSNQVHCCDFHLRKNLLPGTAVVLSDNQSDGHACRVYFTQYAANAEREREGERERGDVP